MAPIDDDTTAIPDHRPLERLSLRETSVNLVNLSEEDVEKAVESWVNDMPVEIQVDNVTCDEGQDIETLSDISDGGVPLQTERTLYLRRIKPETDAFDAPGEHEQAEVGWLRTIELFRRREEQNGQVLEQTELEVDDLKTENKAVKTENEELKMEKEKLTEAFQAEIARLNKEHRAEVEELQLAERKALFAETIAVHKREQAVELTETRHQLKQKDLDEAASRLEDIANALESTSEASPNDLKERDNTFYNLGVEETSRQYEAESLKLKLDSERRNRTLKADEEHLLQLRRQIEGIALTQEACEKYVASQKEREMLRAKAEAEDRAKTERPIKKGKGKHSRKAFDLQSSADALNSTAVAEASPANTQTPQSPAVPLTPADIPAELKRKMRRQGYVLGVHDAMKILSAHYLAYRDEISPLEADQWASLCNDPDNSKHPRKLGTHAGHSMAIAICIREYDLELGAQVFFDEGVPKDVLVRPSGTLPSYLEEYWVAFDAKFQSTREFFQQNLQASQ